MPPPNAPAGMNTPQTADGLWARGSPRPYDDVIDVRSPGEFAEDHIPGAVNLPVLDDAERAEVGTVFRHDGPFPARKLGAAYVSANIGRHLRGYFAAKPKDYRPLVYCWRGGQRSASLAIVLAQIGWRVTTLRGGYKTYRVHVRRELEIVPPLFAYRVIAGPTGTGKTRLLHALADRGAQVLDLENLAGHRGSVLGGVGGQPSQKAFESRLLAAFGPFTPAATVWVESESNRIGDLFVPPALWTAMRAAAGFDLCVPVAGRVGHLLAEYAHLVAAPDTLKALLDRLAARHGRRQIHEWNAHIDAGEWPALVASLLARHYDPAYAASARACYPNVVDAVELAAVTPEALGGLAAALLMGEPGA